MARNVTPTQLKALTVLLAGGNDIEAAEAADVRRETVNRWKRDDTFQAAFREQEALILPTVTRKLIGSLADCATYLVDVVNDEEKSDTLRIRAAAVLLDRAIKYKETTELAARLDALEKVMT